MGFINQKMNRRYNNRNRRAIGINIRLPILAACLGWIITQKYLKSRLLPHGPAQKMEWEDRPTYAAVDKTNDSLQAKRKLMSFSIVSVMLVSSCQKSFSL
jgi:hypothetical protein